MNKITSKLMCFLDKLNEAEVNSQSSINLVPSENKLSPLAKTPLSYDFYNRYFFNEKLDPDFWEFRGGQEIGHFEKDFIIPALQRLSKAKFVNIRSISGMSAMSLVVSGFGGKRGNTVVSVSQSSGGHFATQSLISRLGYEPKAVRVNKGKVEESELKEILLNNQVGLIYVDLQNSLSALNIESFSQSIQKYSPSTLLHIDASHTLGLIFGKVMANPLECGADSFGGSTHKSFPGPHKGVIFCNKSNLFDSLQKAQFDMISSHHFAETLSLGIAALEFEYFGKAYALQVVKNAQTLSRELKKLRFDVSGEEPNHTETHQVWLKTGESHKTNQISRNLFNMGIRANIQSDLPGLPGQAFRLGTNEITFEGATEESMVLIAKAFAAARENKTILPDKYCAKSVRKTFKSPFHYINTNKIV